MNLIFVPLLLTVILFTQKTFAEIDYFKDYKAHLSVGYEIQEYSILIDSESSGRELVYSPNLNGLIVPKLTFNDFATVSWAFEIPVNDEEVYFNGKTKYTDVRMAFDLSAFRINFYYLQYRGFYLENSQVVDPAFGAGRPEFIYPDLYARSFGGDLTWIKDQKNFSIKSLESQIERMNQSGGSFLAGLSFSQTYFSNPIALIPTTIQSEFSEDAHLSKGQFTTISSKIGYGYSMAQKWFLGGAFQMGPGLTQGSLESSTGALLHKGAIFSLRAEALVSGGYNGDVYFFSLKTDLRQDYFFLNNSTTSIGTHLVSGGLSVGMHLDEIGF